MNRKVYLENVRKLSIRMESIPQPMAGELLIRTAFCGICGSDMHFFETGKFARGDIPFPHVIGHECAGTVVAVGANVQGFQIGDRVALEPGVPCGECAACRMGKYNLCREMQFRSVPPYEGMLCDYIAHPAKMCYLLPDSVSNLQGALIEPLAIGLHAVRTANCHSGDTAVVLGTGCIGMMTMLALRAYGVKRIIAADLFDSRLETAKRICADEVVNTKTESLVDAVRRLTCGEGADVAFETAGSAVTLQLAADATKPGGTVVMVGNIFQPATFNFLRAAQKELTIRGIFRYCGEFPEAIRLVEEGKIQPLSIVTDIRPLASVQQAFEACTMDKEHTLKSVVQFEEE